MPGFIDTHHHQAWTAIRSSIPDSILINDGTSTPSALQNYFGNILVAEIAIDRFARHYRPQDVYVSELFGGLSQLDNGVTTVLDISQIHHSPQHSDAAVKGLIDAGRRGVLGYFESAGNVSGNQYPQDASRIKQRWFSSSDQLMSHDHGRRSLSRRANLYPGMDDRAPVGTSSRRTHPLAVRHAPDPGRPRRRHRRHQQQHRARTRQPVHPHDRHVGFRLAESEGEGRASLHRVPDRNEHAPWHSADPSRCRASAWSRRSAPTSRPT